MLDDDDDRFAWIEMIHATHDIKVYLAQCKSPQMLIVIKVHESRESYYSEKRMNIMLRNCDIIHLLECYDEQQTLVFEYGGDNFGDFINNAADEELTEPKILSMMKNLFISLHQIHSLGIAHNDIKPENIVIRNNKCYFIDFDESSFVTENKSKAVGTPFYYSPELLLGKEHDLKTDIYALAVTLYHALVGIFPFEQLPGEPFEQYTQNQLDGYINMDELDNMNISANTKFALKRMLNRDPEMRPTIEECFHMLYPNETLN